MWKSTKKAPVLEFLGWLVLVWLIGQVIFFFFEYSGVFADGAGGLTTGGYITLAMVGFLISTPSPMVAMYITLRRRNKIHSVKDFVKLIFSNWNRKKTILITAAFCAAALIVAIIYGTPTGSPWYLFVLAIPVMLIGGGVEEIGWRGFLQPALEKKFPFPLATAIVSAIWFAWHLPLWILPSSSHYSDNLIGFAILLIVWSFIGAAIYKSTKSVFACMLYHAFMNAIGMIYHWTELFDAFPNQIGMYVYFGVALAAAIVIWILADKNQKSQKNFSKSPAN